MIKLHDPLNRPMTRRDWFTVGMVAVCAALLAQVIFFTWQTRSLTRKLAEAQWQIQEERRNTEDAKRERDKAYIDGWQDALGNGPRIPPAFFLP